MSLASNLFFNENTLNYSPLTIKDIYTLDIFPTNVKVSGWIKLIEPLDETKTRFEIYDGTIYSLLTCIVLNSIIVNKLIEYNAVELTGTVFLREKIELHVNPLYLQVFSCKLFPSSGSFSKQKLNLRNNLIDPIPSSVLRIRSYILRNIVSFLIERDFISVPLPNTVESQSKITLDYNFENSKLQLKHMLLLEEMVLSLGKIFTLEHTTSLLEKESKETLTLNVEMTFVSLNQVVEMLTELISYIFQNIVYECEREISICRGKFGFPEEIKLTNFRYKTMNYSDALRECAINKIFVKENRKFKPKILPAPSVQSDQNFHIVPGIQSDQEIHGGTENSYIVVSPKIYFPISEFEKLSDLLSIGICVINMPRSVKIAALEDNPDRITVSSLDLYLPRIGRIASGGIKEISPQLLKFKLTEQRISCPEYEKLREIGNAPHGGFTIFVDKLVEYITT